MELNNLEDKQEANNRLLDEAKRSADGCATSIDKYGDAVRDAADGTEQNVSAVEAMAGAMAASGLKETVDDIAASMMAASEAAQAYQVKIAQVGTIADETVMNNQQIHQSVLALSTDLRKEANEVADAAYNALSAGVDTGNMLNFTAQASKLATAGFTDTATSVDVLTTILNAYKMESSQTEKVASTLVKTQDLGKVTVDQMAKVMGRVIPSAAAYGVNLDNIATAYANMTAAGINAENTTTYLSTMLDELADSGSNVSKVLIDQTGKTFAELMAEGNSLADVLAIIGESVDNDQVKFSNLWSSATAGKAAISLFDGSAAAFNATLQEMANSSGTVEKNYRKMTDVSEYSSQRLEVASKNLSIIAGDQLNPILDKLRESGAAILEVAADVVAENPMLVSVISGLVVGVGALATGLSALMIVKSVTAAMAALNITLVANPVGLVAVGVTALVAAFATFIAQSETAQERVDALTESSRALAETAEAGNKNYEDTVAAATAAHDTVGSYIARLEELEAVGELNNVQQAEYQLILEKIRSLMPELNIELEAQTGLIKGGAAALHDQADAWKEAAIQEAAYARYKDDIAALADAEYELAKNQALLNMEREDAKKIEERLAAATEEYNVAQQKQYDLQCLAASQSGDYAYQLQSATNRTQELAAEIDGLNAELDASKQTQQDLTAAIDVGRESLSENRVLVDASAEAYASMAQQVEESTERFTTGTAEMADATAEASLQMHDAYTEMRQAAQESIDKQIGLFDDLSGKCEMSIEDMVKNLRSQKKAMEDYADNLILAVERGVDEGLIAKLSDGSVESMQILAQIVSGSKEQISALNAAFRDELAAEDYLTDHLGALGVAMGQGCVDLLPVIKASGKPLGEGLVEGIIEGAKSKLPALKKATKGIADSGAKEYMVANDQHSPSRRYRKMAQYDIEGLIVQYREDTQKVKKATHDVADAGYVSAIHARKAALQVLPISAPPKAQDPRTGQFMSILQRMAEQLERLQYLRLDSGAIVGSTANRYDQALGQIAFLNERGAT